jgi:hypothetical protein
MNTKNYTDKDIETIKKMRDLGKTAKQIGAVIGRSPASVSVKISGLRKKGAIPKPEKAARYDGYQPKDDHAESVTPPQGCTGEVNPEKPGRQQKIEEIEQKSIHSAQTQLSGGKIAKIVHEELEKGLRGIIEAKEPYYGNMTLGQLIDLAAQCDFKLFKSEYVFPESHQGGGPAGFYITFFLSTQGR